MGEPASPKQEPTAAADPGAEGLEGVLREFEAIGLATYEAKVLLALMRLASADSVQLARLSGIPRTSVYPVLQELEAKGLAERLSGTRPALWASVGSAEVLERLEAIKEAQLREQRDRMGRLREMVAKILPEDPEAPVPYVRLLPSAAQSKDAFERLFSQARSEILAFSRPPYAWQPGNANPCVLEALKRGVRTRAIYEAVSLQDPQQEALRAEIRAYLETGLEARLVDKLPVKLVIADRELALIAITGPVAAEVGYPTNLLVEQPGFASLMADAFEQRWAKARPFASLDETQTPATEAHSTAARKDTPDKEVDQRETETT